MSVKPIFSYYGRMYEGRKPLRPLSQYLVAERKNMMMEEMKEMEDRLKRHVTECKREIIKEIQSIFADPKPVYQLKKEMKNVI